MVDLQPDLFKLSNIPAVANACGILTDYVCRHLPGYRSDDCEDGYLFLWPEIADRESIRILFVTPLRRNRRATYRSSGKISVPSSSVL